MMRGGYGDPPRWGFEKRTAGQACPEPAEWDPQNTGAGGRGTRENNRPPARWRACTPRTGRLPWCHVARARGTGGEEASRAPSGATGIQTPLRGTIDEGGGGAPLTTGLRRVARVQTCLPARGNRRSGRTRSNAECGTNGKRQHRLTQSRPKRGLLGNSNGGSRSGSTVRRRYGWSWAVNSPP